MQRLQNRVSATSFLCTFLGVSVEELQVAVTEGLGSQ